MPEPGGSQYVPKALTDIAHGASLPSQTTSKDSAQEARRKAWERAQSASRLSSSGFVETAGGLADSLAALNRTHLARVAGSGLVMARSAATQGRSTSAFARLGGPQSAQAKHGLISRMLRNGLRFGWVPPFRPCGRLLFVYPAVEWEYFKFELGIGMKRVRLWVFERCAFLEFLDYPDESLGVLLDGSAGSPSQTTTNKEGDQSGAVAWSIIDGMVQDARLPDDRTITGHFKVILLETKAPCSPFVVQLCRSRVDTFADGVLQDPRFSPPKPDGERPDKEGMGPWGIDTGECMASLEKGQSPFAPIHPVYPGGAQSGSGAPGAILFIDLPSYERNSVSAPAEHSFLVKRRDQFMTWAICVFPDHETLPLGYLRWGTTIEYKQDKGERSTKTLRVDSEPRVPMLKNPNPTDSEYTGARVELERLTGL